MKTARVVVGLAVLMAAAAWLLSRRPPGSRSVSGTVETDEVHVASRYGGRVIRLLAAEGDRLTNGQVIAELDAAELAARRDQARAELAELVSGPRINEIAAARHDWEAVRSDLELARADAARAEQLFRNQTIDAQTRDRAAALVRTLEQRTQAAAARYQLLQEGTRPETLTQARARLAEIETQLAEMIIAAPAPAAPASSLGAGLPTAPQAATEGLPDDGDHSVGGSAGSGDPRRTSETRANSGYVLETLAVKVGDVVGPNRGAATLLPLGYLWARVYVPETWLGSIRLGEVVKVRTDSPARPAFTGVVDQINRQAEFTPRNVQTVEERVRQVFGVKVRLPADTEALRPGMSVDVVFPNVPPPPK